MRPDFEFRAHLSPQVLSPPRAAPPSSPECDARTCPWWPYSSSKDFRANTAMILIILFCALICALAFNAAVRYLLRRHPRSRPTESAQGDEASAESRPKTDLCSASDKAAALPTVVFTSGMELAGAEAECTICLSEFVQGEEIRVLGRCNHGFHVLCIQKWMESHSSCPTCRSCCFPPPSPSSSCSSSSSTSSVVSGCHRESTAQTEIP